MARRLALRQRRTKKRDRQCEQGGRAAASAFDRRKGT